MSYDREGVAAHAANLATNVRGNLRRSLVSLGVVRCSPLARSAAAEPTRPGRTC